MSRSRHFCFTLNNYTQEEITSLREVGCKYLTFGKEVGDEGTPHLQGFVSFKSLKSIPQVRRLLGRAYFKAKVKESTFDQAIDYCHKDGDIFEKGERPLDSKSKGMGEKRRWDDAYDLAKQGDLEAIDKDILIRCYGTLKRIKADEEMQRPKPDTEQQMLWYWGKAGTGKSRKAREDHPDAYLKACNKWWDGYVPGSRSVVLIEDFDIAHNCLAHHMKIWADRYDFSAEVKGGTMRIRPSQIIVTSNYHPSEIWGENPSSLEPILRRFQCVEFKVLNK